MSSSLPSGPLRGITVLDFSTFLAGPFCTQVLADLGAEVIKIESPHGDSSRAIPPHFISEESLYYLSVNRNKKSVVIDLKNPKGRELVIALIGKADVVVENFGPGVCDRLGLNAEDLCVRYPHLVWSSITGFGRRGDRSDLPAYDMIVQALSGVMMITGEVNRPPVRLGIPAGDLVAGLYSCIGILAGLVERGGSAGRIVDIAMFDSLLSMVSYLGAYTLFTGLPPGPQGSRHESIPTYRSFVGSDGQTFVITANTDRMWIDLCAIVGLDHLVADPRFVSAKERLANKEALWSLLEDAFRLLPAATWVEKCNSRDVPAALVKDVTHALDDARQDSRGMIIELESPDGQTIDVVGNPLKFSGEPLEATAAYPPRLGEHTLNVLTQMFGMDDDEIETLRADGAVQVGSLVQER